MKTLVKIEKKNVQCEECFREIEKKNLSDSIFESENCSFSQLQLLIRRKSKANEDQIRSDWLIPFGTASFKASGIGQTNLVFSLRIRH